MYQPCFQSGQHVYADALLNVTVAVSQGTEVLQQSRQWNLRGILLDVCDDGSHLANF